jgi:rod shape-determining protein MreC
MRHKSTVWLLLPLLAALFLLALPSELNRSLRDGAGLLFSSFWRALPHSHKKEVSLQEKEAVSHFLQEKEVQKEAQIQAAKELLQQLEKAHSKEVKIAPGRLLIAHVIYRSIHTWNSSLWIDIGSDDNPQNGPLILAKNSPVLVGDVLVGIVDFVGKKTSLVRLISDSGFTPAVRAARGGVQKKHTIRKINELQRFVCENKEVFAKEDEQKALLFLLHQLKENLTQDTPTSYLAKGELQGSVGGDWRQAKDLLRGVGFNYDFKDARGPARDLRTGIPLLSQDEPPTSEKLALLQVGDLLITSGLDGLFQEGIKVATVESITPLREGAYSYELTARSLVDLQDLDTLFVLPPQPDGAGRALTKTDKILSELGSH